MKELREEAKELGINAFNKNADVLKEEIAAKKIRRTEEDIDVREVEKQIREHRARIGYDPQAPSYNLKGTPTKPGWKYFWANATENRIFALKQQGYQVDETCPPISAGDNSNGVKMIRMMIPEAIYNEDFARKMKLIKDTEDSLRKASVKGGIQQEDGAYGDINIGEKRVKLGS